MQAKLKLSARAEPGRDPLVADRDPEGQTLADWATLAGRIEARSVRRAPPAQQAIEERLRREVAEGMEIERRLPGATTADALRRAYERMSGGSS